MPNVNIIPSDEFRRQAKRLLKKNKTLLEDLAELQRMLFRKLGVESINEALAAVMSSNVM